MGLFSRLISKPMRAEVEACCGAAGIAIVQYLFKRYEPRYGEQTGAALAGAVTNGLFGAPPGNEKGRQFLAANGPLVDSHLRALTSETEICSIVSKLAHTKFNIATKTGTVTPEMILWLNKMRDLGVLLPLDRVALPPTLDEMREQVASFQTWAHSR